MADTTVSAETTATQLQAGAADVYRLLQSIDTVSRESVDPDSEADPRDYGRMAAVVRDALARYADATQSQREGFCRALTDLLCINADGCSVDPARWDAIANTGGPVRLLPDNASLGPAPSAVLTDATNDLLAAAALLHYAKEHAGDVAQGVDRDADNLTCAGSRLGFLIDAADERVRRTFEAINAYV